ncbi:MAG TPA: PAS domain S-box protein [Steroidobacteraceae bacterium]|nr:PAS domain S-box protein [Steroidobacteraceae bacterium]
MKNPRAAGALPGICLWLTWILLGMAGAIMLGWWSGWSRLVRIEPGIVPVQFNTALCFALSALALLTLRPRSAAWSRIFAAAVCALALVTLVEYILNVSLGVDAALLRPAFVDRTARPGRMAPACAFAFILCAISIISLSYAGRLSIARQWSKSCATVAVLVACLALPPTFSATATVRALAFSDIAPQTVLMFVVLAAALVLSAAAHTVDAATDGISDNLRRFEWRLAWGSALLAALVFLTWQNLELDWWGNRQGGTLMVAQTMADEIRSQIGQRAAALQHFADQTGTHWPPGEERWDREAGLCVRGFRAFDAVSLVGADYALRWRTLRAGRGQPRGTALAAAGVSLETYRAAAAARAVRLTAPQTLPAGDTQVKFVAPIFADGRLQGYLAAEVRTTELLQTLVGPQAADFAVTLRDQGRIIADNGHSDAAPGVWRGVAPIDALGRHWTLRIVPRPEYLRRRRSLLPAAIFVFGLLTDALMTVAFLQVRRSILNRDRADRMYLRLTATLESISNAFFTLDRSWRFTYLNREAERVLQRSRDTLLGRNVWEEFPAAVDSNFQREYRRALSENCSVEFEEYYAPLQAWFLVRAYPTREGLAVYFDDITKRRADEAQLRLLQSAVAQLNDIVLITEAEPIDEPGPRIVFVNDAFLRRTGYAREEVIGRSPRFLQGPKTQREELDRVRAALTLWQPVRSELVNYTKSGEEFRLDLVIVPLADASGRHTHWVSVGRDITDRHALEAQLRESQRLESVGQLTGGVAHDFNNLLTVIMGNAELLRDELATDPRSRLLAEMITAAAQRGAELTQRLLAFARRQALDPKVVDVNRLVSGMDGLLRRTLGEPVEIELVRAGGLWPALVDPGQLESALLNLCLNARDAMGAAGGRLTIETANVRLDDSYAQQHVEMRPGQYVLVAVSDTGSGIDPAHVGRVFEPFFTTKERGKGTGLGLAMVHGFVKQSGGHVSIYSEHGHGTTVKMYLPRANEAQDASAAAGERPVAGGAETILVVEDDELVRRYACEQLSALGYRVVEAADGRRALEILRRGDPVDLLFTDVVMPGGISGRQLVEEGRALRPGLRVLYTSGYTENAIVHHGRLDAGVQLLGKPYRRAELAKALRQALGG